MKYPRYKKITFSNMSKWADKNSLFDSEDNKIEFTKKQLETYLSLLIWKPVEPYTFKGLKIVTYEA